VVGMGFIIELTGLKGRKRLDVPITSLMDYEF
jgi:adenine/guanine phosphoribosyltransferase-like PRPP-binding protein